MRTGSQSCVLFYTQIWPWLAIRHNMWLVKKAKKKIGNETLAKLMHKALQFSEKRCKHMDKLLKSLLIKNKS